MVSGSNFWRLTLALVILVFVKGADIGRTYGNAWYPSAWTLQAELRVPEAGDTYGSTPVFLSGRGFTTLITGYDKTNPGIYVHTNDDGYATRGRQVWTQQAKLVPAGGGNPTDGFGKWIVSHGHTVLASAPHSAGGKTGTVSDAGAIYVFNGTLRHWTQMQKLTAADGMVGDHFGELLSMNKDRVVISAAGAVGASFHASKNTPTVGACYVYERKPGGVMWSRMSKLYAKDMDEGNFFSDKVGVYDDWVVSTAKNDFEPGLHSGSAYMFKQMAGKWSQQQKLMAADLIYWQPGRDFAKYEKILGVKEFANDIALEGTVLAAGYKRIDQNEQTVNGVYVFQGYKSTNRWSLQQRLFTNPTDEGTDVLMNNTMVKLKENNLYATVNGPNQLGNTYLFKTFGKGWSLQQAVKPRDAFTELIRETCNAGYGVNADGTCSKCALGFYKPAAGDVACTPCKASYATASTGSISPSACSLCVAGFYGTTVLPNDSGCTACNVGYTTASSGSSVFSDCKLCEAGYGGDASANPNFGGCTACSASRYKSTFGNEPCAICALNSASCGGTSAGICNAGYSSTDSGVTCTACLVGEYKSAAGNVGCLSCAAGFTTITNGRTSVNACNLCIEGTYGSAVVPNTSGCTLCKTGYTTPSDGSTTKDDCKVCAVGYAGDAQADPNSTGCTACESGKYKLTAANANCVTCAENNSGCGATTAGACKPGYSSLDDGVTCTACAIGQYKNMLGNMPCAICSANNAACGVAIASPFTGLCNAGYGTTDGGATCIACEVGKFKPNAGNGACLSCNAGYTTPGTNSITPNACSICVIGRYGLTVVPNTSGCTPCAPGYTTAALSSPASSSCNLCAAGYGQRADGFGGSAAQNPNTGGCYACATGYYKSLVGNTLCSVCSGNNALCGGPTAGACDEGYTSVNEGVTCTACPLGQYKPLVGNTACTACPIVFTTASVGSIGSSQCSIFVGAITSLENPDFLGDLSVTYPSMGVPDYEESRFIEPSLHGGNLFHKFRNTNLIHSRFHNGSCLLIWMSDHFLDGWDTAVLTVRAPDQSNDTFHPHCDQVDPFYVRYCPYQPEDEGVYIVKVFAAIQARFFWEISWQVQVESTGLWYKGDFATKMRFNFNSTSDAFSFFDAENLVALDRPCFRCTTLSRSSWKELQVPGGDSFWPLDVWNAPFYISDLEGRNLMSMGDLCINSATGEPVDHYQCHQRVKDGFYLLRIGGGLFGRLTGQPYAGAKWKGCDSEGDDRTQLIFRIADGKCTPVQTYKYATRCARPPAFDMMGILGIDPPTAQGTVAPTVNVFGAKYVKYQMYEFDGTGIDKGDGKGHMEMRDPQNSKKSASIIDAMQEKAADLRVLQSHDSNDPEHEHIAQVGNLDNFF